MQPHHASHQLDGTQRVPQQLDAARKVAEPRQAQQCAREDLGVAPVQRVKSKQRRIAGRCLGGHDAGGARVMSVLEVRWYAVLRDGGEHHDSKVPYYHMY